MPFAVQILLIIVLVMLSGLFSGLTLGLMSLDRTGLEIVAESDDPRAAAAATAIMPVRRNGNLLLCTLLLGNVAVNALLSIIMAELSSGLVGFLSSTVVIVLFGEILPQAACSRHALAIGQRAVPIVRVLLCLLYVLAAPLAKALDLLLGRELATTYDKSEMIKLLQIHVDKGVYDQETGNAVGGALKYQDRTVEDVMTPIGSVFMLDGDERLSFATIAKIFKSGYSRIPVYRNNSKDNIMGLLMVKDLIFVDPEDETPVKHLVQIFGRSLHVVWPTDDLGSVLRELKQGRSHMALVRDVNKNDSDQDPFYEIKGIITLEDVIEEILGDEIVDETDAFVENTHAVRVDRENFDWGKLRLLDAKITDETLSGDESRAVAAHLRVNHPDAFRLVSDAQLRRWVSSTVVSELSAPPPAALDHGADVAPPSEHTLYDRGTLADHCTLVLSGKVAVLSGRDGFRADLSAWSVLALDALTDSSYAPDFTAFVSHGPCRCLRFRREDHAAAVDASAAERAAERSSNNHNATTTTARDDETTPSPRPLSSLGRSSSRRTVSDDNGDVVARRTTAVATPRSRDGDENENENESYHRPIDEALSSDARRADVEPAPPPPRRLRTKERMTALQIELTNGGSLMPGRATNERRRATSISSERSAEL